jgi:tetratricopeptide (TPR) repeat protein
MLCLLTDLWKPVGSFSPAAKPLHISDGPSSKPNTRYNTRLYQSATSDHSSTAADRARRDEEKSRLDRRQDVVIGQTSAKAGAKDLTIDARHTEQAWLSQASKVEQQVYQWSEKGLERLKMFQVEEAIEEFDKVFAVKPGAYLWQAGVATFYINDIAKAAEIFARNGELYESKFGQPASEERIWRNACALKLYHEMSRSDKKRVDEEEGGIDSLVRPIRVVESESELLQTERRKVIRIARDLFAASVNRDHSGVILARAKLRSIGSSSDPQLKLDRKMWRLNAWYYLGLHYDVLGEYDESKKCMKRALMLCPSSGNADDIVHALPLLHMSRRNWFDEEETETDSVDEYDNERIRNARAANGASPRPSAVADTILLDSIMSSLQELRHIDLKDALKLRGLPSNGSKDDMQDRLLHSLVNDASLGLDAYS